MHKYNKNIGYTVSNKKDRLPDYNKLLLNIYFYTGH